MTDVTTSQDQQSAELSAAGEQLLRELTERARADGLQLTGEVVLVSHPHFHRFACELASADVSG